jgi:hypothetical protein
LVPSPAFFGRVRGLRLGGGEWRRASGRRPGASRQDAQEIAPIEPIVHACHRKTPLDVRPARSLIGQGACPRLRSLAAITPMLPKYRSICTLRQRSTWGFSLEKEVHTGQSHVIGALVTGGRPSRLDATNAISRLRIARRLFWLRRRRRDVPEWASGRWNATARRYARSRL